MNGNKSKMSEKLGRLLVRSLLVLALIGVLVLSFLAGKGHTILVDNKDVSGGSISAIDGILVSVDGKEELELYSGDRDMQKVKGQSHVVKVEIINDGTKFEKRIALPLMTEMMLLSIPKLVAGIEPCIETFVPLDVAPPADESVGNTNSFTSPDAVPEAMPLSIQ